MSQRQMLIGGVELHNVLPAPTVFAEPSVIYFSNRDDTASMTQTEATYDNIVGMTSGELHFTMWFAGVFTAASTLQSFTAKSSFFDGDARPASSSRTWRTTMGRVRGLVGVTSVETLIQQEDASPLGQIRASGLLAFPRGDMGVNNQDYFFTSSINNNTSFNDTNNLVTTFPIDIKSTEDYIVFWSMAHLGGADYERNFRFTPRIDDEDIVHVRTDSTSGGAARTGRGFSVQKGAVEGGTDVGSSGWSGVAVLPIEKGTRTPGFRAGIWENEAGAGENVANANMVIIRKAMFEQAEITKVSSKIQNTSESLLDTTLEVAINSTKKVAVIVSSSYMSGQVGGPEVQLWRENAGGGGGVELVQPIELAGESNETDAAASTDRDLYPLWMFYVDDNPGDVVYKLRLGRATAGAATNTINVRDDGTDGFDGYIMALELSFGTDT